MRYLIIITLVGISITSFAQESFSFEDKQVLPGSKEHFTIPISDGKHETFIPITVFQGNEKGPVLGITAGVHGYEYSPILAGQALIGKIDPEKLKGTVILVHASNVDSFLGRSPYVNPNDGKNLNRSFPGNADGTITERIADYISTKVIPRCTHFIDAHSGDAPEDLIPYSGYYHNDGMPEVSAKGKEMAENLGFDYILVFQTTGKDYMKDDMPSLYCSAQAFKLGIPAADIECGRLGMVEQDNVDKIVDGLLNLMISMGMMENDPAPVGEKWVIKDRSSVQSGSTGFFYRNKEAGDYVTKGMNLGYITDFFGNTIEEVFTEEAGVLLYILGTPPINKDETIASIGVLK